MDFRIRKARVDDAPYISKAIMEAVGEEITLGFAGSADRVELVDRLFRELAQDDNSQYSYRNSFVAETSDNRIAGVIIFYDGSKLRELRKRFLEKVRKILGYEWSEADMTDEASSDEIYVDTLCVFEQYRHNGIAKALLSRASEEAEMQGKPLGLIVDKDNATARRLYEGIGFRQVGETPFAGEMMDHLQKGF